MSRGNGGSLIILMGCILFLVGRGLGMGAEQQSDTSLSALATIVTVVGIAFVIVGVIRAVMANLSGR